MGFDRTTILISSRDLKQVGNQQLRLIDVAKVIAARSIWIGGQAGSACLIYRRFCTWILGCFAS